MSFFAELKRRNVIRVGVAYVVAAWVLLQVADLVLENIEAPAWIIQVMMLVVVLGFVAAVIIAWAYELTPEGIRRESEIEPDASITAHTGRKLDRIIIGFLVVAVALLLLDRFRTREDAPSAGVPAHGPPAVAETAATGPEKSIAVLPLANRSVRPEDAFFAEGIHDELLTQLSRVSALKVISRTSVMGYAGTTKRMTDIGRELGVATLLEGGVQRSGDRVRINVQLIEAATDEHLWAEVYDRELTADNLFDIQSDITRAIAGALKAVLTGAEQESLDQKPTQNVEAYAHYLRGKASAKGYGRRTAEIDESIAAFQAAIDLDPRFADAFASLSIDWSERYWGSDKLGDEIGHALENLRRAQALAPDAAETLTAAGYYHYWGHLDYARAIEAFNQALAREPHHYLALRGKGYVLRRMGRIDESIATMERVIAVDPLDAAMPSDLGYTLMRAGEFERADAMLQRALALDSTTHWNRYTSGEYFLVLGDLEKARQLIGEPTFKAGAWFYQLQLYLARVLDEPERADRIMEEWENMEGETLGWKIGRANLLHDRGLRVELDQLLDELETPILEAIRERPGQETNLLNLVNFRALRGDRPGFNEAVAAYYAAMKSDAMRKVEVRDILVGYVRVGDTEAALTYIEDMVAGFGPWEFYYVAQDPVFDLLRNEPRYLALAQAYREWLEQQ